MEITIEMQENLRQIAKTNLDFIEFVKKNPACLKRSNFQDLETTRYIFKMQSWPTFINAQTKALFAEKGMKVFNLIKSIPARLFANDPKPLAAYFNQSETVVAEQLTGLTDENLAHIVGRMDFAFSPPGLKCLEFNISVGTSGWQLPEWESLYLKIPLIDRFIKEYHVKINNENFPQLFLEHIIRFASPLASPGKQNGKPELNLILATQGYTETGEGHDPVKESLLEYLRTLYQEKLTPRALNGNVFMCDYPHLEYHDDMVYYRGNRVHALIELFHGFLPPGVMKAYTSGKIRLLNGPMTGLLSNKLNLALLSENEDSPLFSSEEKETIKNHIPWTRKIIPGETLYKGENIRLENFLITHKDNFVIKPSLGLGGGGVCIGQDTFRKKWEYLVNNALQKKTFLVQELVEPPCGLYQVGDEGCAYHDTVWGAWILGSRYAGSLVRAAVHGHARKVVNSAQGALISTVFEVDE